MKSLYSLLNVFIFFAFLILQVVAYYTLAFFVRLYALFYFPAKQNTGQ